MGDVLNRIGNRGDQARTCRRGFRVDSLAYRDVADAVAREVFVQQIRRPRAVPPQPREILGEQDVDLSPLDRPQQLLKCRALKIHPALPIVAVYTADGKALRRGEPAQKRLLHRQCPAVLRRFLPRKPHIQRRAPPVHAPRLHTCSIQRQNSSRHISSLPTKIMYILSPPFLPFSQYMPRPHEHAAGGVPFWHAHMLSACLPQAWHFQKG